jgi:hypothetical protein
MPKLAESSDAMACDTPAAPAAASAKAVFAQQATEEGREAVAKWMATHTAQMTMVTSAWGCSRECRATAIDMAAATGSTRGEDMTAALLAQAHDGLFSQDVQVNARRLQGRGGDRRLR